MKKMLSRFLTVVVASFAVLVMTCAPVLAAGNITESQAKKIALKDAGLKEKAVIFLKIELDEGKMEDTEVASEEAVGSSTDQNSSENTEAKETEYSKSEAKDKESKPTEDASESTDESSSEDAKSNESISEYTISDESTSDTASVPKYEIEFYHDGTEYEYEIDAKTGEILKVSKDTEFFLNPGALPTTLP